MSIIRNLMLCDALIFMTIISVGLQAQTATPSSDDRTKVIGLGFSVLPGAVDGGEAIIISLVLERFLNPKNSIVFRPEFVRYGYKDDESYYYKKETGYGAGFGFSYRHYFSNYGGFFVSAALDVGKVQWEYEYYEYNYAEADEGGGIGICPNLSIGYRFNIGDRFVVTPSMLAGYRFGRSGDTNVQKETTITYSSEPVVGLGIVLGYRL